MRSKNRLVFTGLAVAVQWCVRGRGGARHSLFTVSGMSDSPAHSQRRANSLCSMLMKMHPLNGLRLVLSGFASPTTAPTLPPIYCLTHPHGNDHDPGSLCAPWESLPKKVEHLHYQLLCLVEFYVAYIKRMAR